MSDEIVNKDNENSPKKVKGLEEAVEVVKKMEKIIRSNKCRMLWLAYQQGKISETFKANNKSINLVNNFGISKSTMVFKIYFVKFPNNYLKMKKSLLPLHFLKNNFKIIKKFYHE